MIADLVALGDYAFYDVGRCLAVLADDKEGGLDVLAFQDIKDLRRPDRIRPVVERQCRSCPACRPRWMTYDDGIS